MASTEQKTSLITLLTCEHGRLRREQRDIDKRDLQKALKYGTLDRSWGRRWKVQHDGIIFITDDSRRREITAFPSPLAFAPIDSQALMDHEKAKQVLHHKPGLCVSHTVLVVDNSGSMSTHDIPLHRDRQVAAYTVTALEFVAEQLFNDTANNSDVVSLIEFSNTANVIFTREPVSWVLFNKLLKRRDARDFKGREMAKQLEFFTSDSNYLPALDEAEILLSKDVHEDCALSLLFLSDGSPSDSKNLGITHLAARTKLCDKMKSIAAAYGGQLGITMLGFGSSYQDFSVLSAMAEAAKEASGLDNASFFYCDKIANAMGTAVTSMVTSLTATRTALAERVSKRTERTIEFEGSRRGETKWKYFKIIDHSRYDPRAKRGFVPYSGLPPGAINGENQDEASRLQRKPPIYLALNSNAFGKGAERVAFRCSLSHAENVASFALGEMIAKETRLVERVQENVEFHACFCEQQHLASHLAQQFNRRLAAIPQYDPLQTPRIEFLPCSVLLLDDPDWAGGTRGVLVEKKLDTEKFGWCKWNNNAGGLQGVAPHLAIDVDRELAEIQGGGVLMDTLVEEDSEEESDESDSDEEHSMTRSTSVNKLCSEEDMVKPADYLQAFSHFTHRFTNRKVLVCDLQGVFNTDHVPPTFELTDPAIHYHSKRGRQMVFGRTDKGRKGVDLFFKTHKCTKICKFMQLSRKNKEWRKEWKGSMEY